MNSQFKPLVGVIGIAFTIAASTLHAQAKSAAPAATALEEVTVTARKQTESLLDVPVSITAISAKDIENKGLRSLEDIQHLAPGMQFSNQGQQIAGRYDSTIRFRGMNVNNSSPSLQLGALFVDGTYVLGGTQSIPFDDIQRVEVVKGPQSATYGRSTFGGAINYITKTPSLTESSGQVSFSEARFNDQTFTGSYEMPLIQDKLAVRIGGNFYSRGATFRATDGGGLGEESSKSGQITLFAKPVDDLRVKFRAFYDLDSDGPAAGGLIEGYNNDTCTGLSIATQDPAVPIAKPKNYICGQVPTQGQAISPTALLNPAWAYTIIDAPTNLFPKRAAAIGLPNYLIDNLVTRPLYSVPGVISAPYIDHMGLERNVFRVALNVDYDFAGGYTATLQGGYNRLRANWIREFGGSGLGFWYSRDPEDSKDKSAEFRISSPQNQRFTWLVGVNTYTQDFIQSGSGGDAITLCMNFSSTVAPPLTCAATPSFTASTLLQNTDHIKTTGVFGAANFNITDQWTVSAELRRQDDTDVTGVLTTQPTEVKESNTLPRAIIRFKPTKSSNIYLSWAKGLLAPQVNAQLATATARELAQYQAQFPNAQAIVPGDQLKMTELGWKQQLLENRAFFNIDAYYGEWKNQKGRAVALIQEDCGSVSHGVSNAASGCPNGPNGQPAVNPNGTPFFNSRNVNIGGDSKLWGVEAEGAIQLTERWDAHANLTWAKSKYDSFFFNFVTPIAGFSQMKGNSNARFPDWMAYLGSTYKAPFRGDWGWFVAGDVNYIGKTYVDESNLAYCKGYYTANAQVGFEKSGVRLEAFVKNLFDDKNWTACNRWTDFDHAPSLALLTVNQGVVVTPQIPRQLGVRAILKF